MNTCANCAAELTGPFCANCGQEHQEAEPSLGHVLRDLWDDVIKIDGKVLTTLKLLFTQPGQLTLEYFEGRRIRHVTPFKLYLTLSAVYFLLSNFSYIRQKIERQSAIKSTSTSAETAALIQDVIAAGTRYFFDHLSTILILIVPFTAISTAILFRGSRRSFLFHLVFVLHVWSFLFLTVGVLGALNVPLNFFQFFLVCSIVYMIPASRRVFKRGWTESVAKSFLFGASVMTVCVLTLIVIVGGHAYQRKSALAKSIQGQPSPSRQIK